MLCQWGRGSDLSADKSAATTRRRGTSGATPPPSSLWCCHSPYQLGRFMGKLKQSSARQQVDPSRLQCQSQPTESSGQSEGGFDRHEQIEIARCCLSSLCRWKRCLWAVIRSVSGCKLVAKVLCGMWRHVSNEIIRRSTEAAVLNKNIAYFSALWEIN